MRQAIFENLGAEFRKKLLVTYVYLNVTSRPSTEIGRKENRLASGFGIVNQNPRRTYCPLVPKQYTFSATKASPQILSYYL